MTSRPQIHYAEILNDLRARRDQIDQAIIGLEALVSRQKPAYLGNVLVDQPLRKLDAQRSNLKPQDRIATSLYRGQGILTAARLVLSQSKQTRTAHELAEAVIAGRYPARSRNFANTVAAVLNRCDKTGGNVIRVGKNLFTLVDERHAITDPTKGAANE